MASSKRSGWRNFLTPGWVITAILVLAFTYAAFSFLAPWQLGKNKDKNAFNQRLEQSLQTDPAPITDVIPGDGGSVGVEKEWTRVALQGQFLPDKEVLLRNRPVESAHSYQALTPFRLDGGQTVLVHRGWVAVEGDGAAPKLKRAPGDYVKVTGFIRMSEAVPDAKPTESQGYTQVTGMSTKQISEVTDEELAADYVQLDSESVDRLNGMAGGGADGDGSGDAGSDAGVSGGTDSGDDGDDAGVSGGTDSGEDGDAPDLQALPLPHLDGGTNLSYGIQWIAFGILAPVGLGWFVYAEMRERRREREESAEVARLNAQITDGAGGVGDGAGSAVGARSGAAEAAGDGAAKPKPAESKKSEPSDAEKPKSRKRSDLTDRYGGTRSRFEERRAEKRGRERF
ncbi:SURF1 family cytochrome oxidase biogenesis protein [Corynebacterium jeikeium]|uniref:SURF1 family cytochrome oxidase biogenesis protein n=1 Tax=Corynebacterium jeikeium TaxID=38289 RepID=UPI00210CCEF8|nr:SURF1 family cytochrome oxidase biogenesis protein [Corynebacterium jeikeium]